MSEKEILRRQEYKRNRQQWLMIQAIALALAVILALCSFLVYDRLTRDYYIEYTEEGSIDYCVQYQKSDFFENPMLDEDRAYISSLIENIFADFHYQLHMDTAKVGFDYSYRITAQVVVADKDSGNPYYTVDEELVPYRQVTTKSGRKVQIDEQVTLDFQRYNEMARKFTAVYDLRNASSTLVVTLDVQVISSSDRFSENNENTYSTSLHIPLNLETTTIHQTSNAPAAESKVLAYKSAVNERIFLVIGYVAAALALILLLVMLVYMYTTKNEDVTYTARVRRLLSAYSSYIQRLEGEFDDRGYQILVVKTFDEMLGIRDTLQAPILMTENRDQTMSRFLIPTDSKLLYVYDIKVDNYDEIYGIYANPALRERRKKQALEEEIPEG